MSLDGKNPSRYRRHKHRRQALVTLSDGRNRSKDAVLGGTRESRKEYTPVLDEEARGRQFLPAVRRECRSERYAITRNRAGCPPCPRVQAGRALGVTCEAFQDFEDVVAEEKKPAPKRRKR
jgi:hypothetical protein